MSDSRISHNMDLNTQEDVYVMIIIYITDIAFNIDQLKTSEGELKTIVSKLKNVEEAFNAEKMRIAKLNESTSTQIFAQLAAGNLLAAENNIKADNNKIESLNDKIQSHQHKINEIHNEFINILMHFKQSKPDLLKEALIYGDYENNLTVLHYAIPNKLLNITKLLIEYGADVNSPVRPRQVILGKDFPVPKDYDNYSPLHQAVAIADLSFVKFLVEDCKADLAATDLNLATAFDDAIAKPNELKTKQYKLQEEQSKEKKGTAKYQALEKSIHDCNAAIQAYSQIIPYLEDKMKDVDLAKLEADKARKREVIALYLKMAKDKEKEIAEQRKREEIAKKTAASKETTTNNAQASTEKMVKISISADNITRNKKKKLVGDQDRFLTESNKKPKKDTTTTNPLSQSQPIPKNPK